jgi:hypothetical protein
LHDLHAAAVRKNPQAQEMESVVVREDRVALLKAFKFVEVPSVVDYRMQLNRTRLQSHLK